MSKQKDFMPMVYEFLDVEMDKVLNTDLFNSYLKTKNVEKIYTGTLWAEGPCYIPHKDMLVWSDNPNNRMMKLVNGKVSEVNTAIIAKDFHDQYKGILSAYSIHIISARNLSLCRGFVQSIIPARLYYKEMYCRIIKLSSCMTNVMNTRHTLNNKVVE